MTYMLILLSFVYAEELGNSDPLESLRPVARPAVTVASGPSRSCVSDPGRVQSILQYSSDHRSDNAGSSATPHPRYDQFRSNLQASSGSDLIARLAYSEVQEAHCEGLNEDMLPLVMEAILNRVEKRYERLYGDSGKEIHELSYQEQKRLVESVVFQKNQYASTLHRYRVSNQSADPVRYSDGYKTFLCPPNDELWSSAKNLTDQFFRDGTRSRNLPSNTYNYYLFNHAPERWSTPPEWTRTLNESSSTQSAALRRCLRLYQEPAYR